MGCPFSCEGLFGIERGVTSNPSRSWGPGFPGAAVADIVLRMGQPSTSGHTFLSCPAAPMPRDGVKNHIITSTLRYPLTGKRVNPYMHPDTYAYSGGGKKRLLSTCCRILGTARKFAKRSFFAYRCFKNRWPGTGSRPKRQIDYALVRFQIPELPRMTGCISGNSLLPAYSDKTDSGSSGSKRRSRRTAWGNDELKNFGI